jgi:hypothetical protein
LHQRLISDGDFINGVYDINWLQRFVDNGPAQPPAFADRER